MGFAAGVMTAAAIWSLLLPALNEAATDWGKSACIPVIVGMLSGGLFLAVLDKLARALKQKSVQDVSALSKATKLFLAVTLHNIPEGLAVGFAFGSAYALGTREAFLSAVALAIGIGVQNFPEGAAVALPLRTGKETRGKAFVYGALSGIVEPIFAVVGFLLVAQLRTLQPWLLAFAAGAMLLVVAEDLLPDLGEGKETDRKAGAWSMLLGFVVMMTLDVVLG